MSDATAPDPIDRLIRKAAASPRVIGLGGGLPSEKQFPRKELAAAFVAALKRQGSPALQYGWPEGQEPLRVWIARRLRERGATVAADDVIITNGAQQAIALAAGLALRKGAPIAVEDASYPAALDLFRSRRLRLTSLSEGRAAYLMPAVNNPSGMALSSAARATLLARRVPLIEDDAYADLNFAGRESRPFLADAPDRTYHVGTMSKTLCPGLRVGWLVVPHSRRQRAVKTKQDVDLQANSLAQAVVDHYLSNHDFDARLRVLRRFYQRRAARLSEAVHKTLPNWTFDFPAGGFCLWIQTDAAVDEKRFLERAVAEGVSFDLGSTFLRHHDRREPNRLRLSFSYEDPTKFTEGVRRLARAWRWAVKSARAR
jgi:2-aminoadipate transaminase